MKKNEVKVGMILRAQVNGKLQDVKITAIREHRDSRGKASTSYHYTNLATGRDLLCRSASKFHPLPSEATKKALKKVFEAEEKTFKCPTCKSEGFSPSTLGPDRCSFCDGTEGGNSPSASDKSVYGSRALSTPMADAPIHEHSMIIEALAPVEAPKVEKAPASGLAARLLTPPAVVEHKTTPSFQDRMRGAGSKDRSPHIIVEARAGSGKTTTLIEGLKVLKGLLTKIVPSPQQKAVWDCLAQSRGKVSSVCFCAFNKSIADELRTRIPEGCEAYTLHALGNKIVCRAFPSLGNPDSYKVQNIISELEETDIRELRRENPILLQATEQLVNLCKMNLVNGSDQEALAELAAYYDVDLNGNSYGPTVKTKARDESLGTTAQEVFALVPRVLEACKDTQRWGFDFSDMIWLPIALNLPITPYDILLVDEAQDLNRCQQALARRAGKRLVLCGDACQPPGTLVTLAGTPGNRWHEGTPGKRVPIEQLTVGDTLIGYCPSDGCNYSNRKVEGISVNPFEGELVEVTTEEGVTTRYTPQHHCYACFGALRDCYAVYIMKRGLQFRIGSCQINYRDAGNGLVHRLRTEEGEASWILEVHATKREARLREMELSHKYGLPQIVFKNGNTGYILDDEGVERFWQFVGNNAAVGLDVLKEYKLEWNRPIAVPGEQWQQSFKRPAIFAAANLVSGMEVRTEEGRWVRINVKRVPYNGPVYSLSVSHDHLYMADGIVTHNCQAIYGFAGADCESLPRMARELCDTERGCVKLPLTVTRRCGKAIVREANQIVQDFSAHESNGEGRVSAAAYPKGNAPSYMAQVEDGDMILCRVNAPLVSHCFRFIKAGRKANIQGRDIGQGLISTIKKMNAVSVTDLVAKLSDWLHRETEKEQVKRNPNEARIIALQDRYDCLVCFTEGANTVEAVTQKIETVFTDDKTVRGIRLSSVHKAKGLESSRVFILLPKGAGMPHPMAKTAWQREQEYNLRYVAITRAINELVWVQEV